MSNYLIKLDPQRCISCKACEVHCQTKNRLPMEAKLGMLISAGPFMNTAGKLQVSSAFLSCFHCGEPWCVAACPNGAMIKRSEDGLVFVDKDLCVGCRACIQACPWKVPHWDETTGKVIKCDLCRDYIDTGQLPACVAGCTTHALNFCKPNESVRQARTIYAVSILVHQESGRRPAAAGYRQAK